MADQTKIEWADATWNPITGCSVISPGCTNCYAMRLAGTRMKHHPSRAGLTVNSQAGPVWNGQVRLNEKWLLQPLEWSRPRLIFVCAHADLFHESVPSDWIDRVFAVMALAPQHTFQVLTKRSKRMHEYLSLWSRPVAIADAMSRAANAAAAAGIFKARAQAIAAGVNSAPVPIPMLPLPNVWLGVSAEDQKRADERIPDLLATPAAVRWVSAEPLLGPLDLRRMRPDGINYTLDALTGRGEHLLGMNGKTSPLDWVVAGGESGKPARPMHPDWARSLRDQCKAAGVAFHFKQWGEWTPFGMIDQPAYHPVRVGKARAGRMLDGVTHDEYPGGAR